MLVLLLRNYPGHSQPGSSPQCGMTLPVCRSCRCRCEQSSPKLRVTLTSSKHRHLHATEPMLVSLQLTIHSIPCSLRVAATNSYKLTKNRHHVAMKKETGNGLPSHKPCIEPASADAEMAPASQPTWEQGCLHIGTNRALSQKQQMPRWPQPANMGPRLPPYSHKPCIEPASADAEMAPASQPTWEQGCPHIGTNRPLSQNQQMPRWPQPASQHGTKAASI